MTRDLISEHMPYVTVNEVRARVSDEALQNLSDEKAQLINNEVIAQLISDAESFVNMYLRSANYVTPIAVTVPEIVKRWTADIATYYLYSKVIEEANIDNIRRQNYERAEAQLKQVVQAHKDGLAAMLYIPLVEVATDSSDAIIGSESTRLYQKDFWKYLP
jgi:phage gp36-like protein